MHAEVTILRRDDEIATVVCPMCGASFDVDGLYMFATRCPLCRRCRVAFDVDEGVAVCKPPLGVSPDAG